MGQGGPQKFALRRSTPDICDLHADVEADKISRELYEGRVGCALSLGAKVEFQLQNSKARELRGQHLPDRLGRQHPAAVRAEGCPHQFHVLREARKLGDELHDVQAARHPLTVQHDGSEGLTALRQKGDGEALEVASIALELEALHAAREALE
eukprot:CAMPEP_0170647758 /NCGR_PEP_ID=MMETSP0224-20130122/44353_1 /TAXON_ID=285029 /ORGANISM="Togula jolla, Strain CCCM 725" /LENGTH=152 /DNA_ID=CAMNT_0010979201 /DNA_START=23 /DNA_END=481 /DNA_ORIENTATION=-